MTTDNFSSYLQNRLIETSQTGGQWYSDTSPFSIPCLRCQRQTQMFSQMISPVANALAYLRRPIKNAEKIYQ